MTIAPRYVFYKPISHFSPKRSNKDYSKNVESMKRSVLLLCLMLLSVISSQAQFGYQLAVLDQETGLPKRNAPVKVAVTITDSNNGVIYSNTYSENTNDFGMVSLQIGDANTFSDVDWNKLPFFISATIDDNIHIGKSQILTVPVAEYAKRTGNTLTKEILCSKTWTSNDDNYYSIYDFHLDGTFTYISGHILYDGSREEKSYTGEYQIDGDLIYTKYINHHNIPPKTIEKLFKYLHRFNSIAVIS